MIQEELNKMIDEAVKDIQQEAQKQVSNFDTCCTTGAPTNTHKKRSKN